MGEGDREVWKRERLANAMEVVRSSSEAAKRLGANLRGRIIRQWSGISHTHRHEASPECNVSVSNSGALMLGVVILLQLERVARTRDASKLRPRGLHQMLHQNSFIFWRFAEGSRHR